MRLVPMDRSKPRHCHTAGRHLDFSPEPHRPIYFRADPARKIAWDLRFPPGAQLPETGTGVGCQESAVTEKMPLYRV